MSCLTSVRVVLPAVRLQKDGYDLFREDLLPGRRCMANLLPMVNPTHGNKVRISSCAVDFTTWMCA